MTGQCDVDALTRLYGIVKSDAAGGIVPDVVQQQVDAACAEWAEIRNQAVLLQSSIGKSTDVQGLLFTSFCWRCPFHCFLQSFCQHLNDVHLMMTENLKIQPKFEGWVGTTWFGKNVGLYESPAHTSFNHIILR